MGLLFSSRTADIGAFEIIEQDDVQQRHLLCWCSHSSSYQNLILFKKDLFIYLAVWSLLLWRSFPVAVSGLVAVAFLPWSMRLGTQASVGAARRYDRPPLALAGQWLWHMDLVAPWHVGSSQTRDRISVLCIARQMESYYF